jgi:26S proteasome regulatory subunit N2
VAQVLQTLLSNSQEEIYQLTALQIAFLLQDTGHHAFVQAVAQELDRLVPSDSDAATTNTGASVQKVLTGGFASELKLSFLHKHNKADRLIMEQLKKGLEGSSRSNSILHNAAVMTHSYLYCGTTNDSFLRDYLDWMKKASNWYVCVCLFVLICSVLW